MLQIWGAEYGPSARITQFNPPINLTGRKREVSFKITAEFGKTYATGIKFQRDFFEKMVTLIFVFLDSIPNG